MVPINGESDARDRRIIEVAKKHEVFEGPMPATSERLHEEGDALRRALRGAWRQHVTGPDFDEIRQAAGWRIEGKTLIGLDGSVEAEWK